jgi:FkbM family methyltransferase
VIFDVGANVGDYAGETIRVFSDRVTIHCFEPSRRVFDALSERFGHRNNVVTHPIALGDVDGETVLYSDHDGSPLASLYRRQLDQYGLQFSLQESVVTRRLDSVCRDLDVASIDLLKLDVEGHELAVLKGAGNLIQSGAIRFIQFEFGGTGVDARVYFRDYFDLLNPRYHIYRIVRNGLHPIVKYDVLHEVFLTSNFLAVWRGD